MDEPSGYELVDFGEGERLERFGDRLVVRPHPSALGRPQVPAVWRGTHLRFERGRGWTPGNAREPWESKLEGLTLELEPTEAGQVGLFPEHASMLPWLRDRIAELATPAVLHLFAYTGMVTLAMAAAGVTVTHVDAARPTVAWARRNAVLSGLADRPIRWIVDDALAFTRREVRRGRRYQGVVLDPPTYGHGAGGSDWRAARDLDVLLLTVRAVLEPDGFILLTSHTPELDPERLAGHVATTFDKAPGAVERGVLSLQARDERILELGSFARWPGGA